MQELLKALVRARKNFTAINKNMQGFGYKYADLGELFKATLPALAAEGVVVIQFPICPAPQTMGIRTELWHESGEHFSYEFIPELNLQNVGTQKGVQALGSLISYLKRYHFAAIMGLAAEDDDGATAVQELSAKEKEPLTKSENTIVLKPKEPKEEQASVKSENAKAFKANEADEEKKQKLKVGIRELLNKRWPDVAARALKMAELGIDLNDVKDYDVSQLTKVLEALTNAK